MSRLVISAITVDLSADRKTNMKSVNNAISKEFERRFSGDSSEDWVDHVNELEVRCAKKNGWTARQFFYTLRASLSGAALQTWTSLERDEV